MGTFTPRGLGFIWQFFFFFLRQRKKLFPATEMVLIILAFQGIPLGGSGGPKKDRMFCFCGDFTFALLGFVWPAGCLLA